MRIAPRSGNGRNSEGQAVRQSGGLTGSLAGSRPASQGRQSARRHNVLGTAVAGGVNGRSSTRYNGAKEISESGHCGRAVSGAASIVGQRG